MNGFAFDMLDKVLEEAIRSAEPSHSYPEGIKGAQAVAAAVYLGRTGATKDEIKAYSSSSSAMHSMSRSIRSVSGTALTLPVRDRSHRPSVSRVASHRRITEPGRRRS